MNSRQIKDRKLSKAHLAVASLTLIAAILGLLYARSAYNIASQQIKDIGSWLKVRIVDFQYVRPGEDKHCGPKRFKDLDDTEGCFFIEVTNRLSVKAKNIRFDHKVPPEDWISDWKVKEGISESENVFSLSGFESQTFVLYRSIAQDPINYYCQNNNNLKLFVNIKWQDEKNLDYELTRKFIAGCLETKAKETKFKWLPLTEISRG